MNKKNNILQNNIEEENRLKQDELLDRVLKLKDVSLNIGSYLVNEKRSLVGLNNDYDKSLDMVKKSLSGIGQLLKQGFGQSTCYLIGIVLVVILILYNL